MDLPKNTFKQALKEGRPQIGLWFSMASAYAAEVVAGAGFDWILVDTEHSPNDVLQVHAQLQALGGGSAVPVVRPAWNDMVLIKRYLDLGVQTLLIPYVQSEHEARDAVRYTRYPPAGVRGVGGTTRATHFGRIKDYPHRAHEELCVLVQVETRGGLDQIAAIAAVEGVDGVFIGPSDLAAGLGHLGNPNHPEVQDAIVRGIHRVRGLGKAAGILTTDEALARQYLAAGAQFVAVGNDIVIYARETEKLAARFRQ